MGLFVTPFPQNCENEILYQTSSWYFNSVQRFFENEYKEATKLLQNL